MEPHLLYDQQYETDISLFFHSGITRCSKAYNVEESNTHYCKRADFSLLVRNINSFSTCGLSSSPQPCCALLVQEIT